MEFGDIFWAVIWFGAGLYIFEETSLKSFLDAIGVIIMIISLFAIATKPEFLAHYLQNVPVSYFAGALTHYIYLIGANIGRANHFHEDINYGRIILYGVIIIGLIIILNNFNANSTI